MFTCVVCRFGNQAASDGVFGNRCGTRATEGQLRFGKMGRTTDEGSLGCLREEAVCGRGPNTVHLAAADARITPWDSELGAKGRRDTEGGDRRSAGRDMLDPWTGEIAGPYCRSL